jgi:hypothetical protein
MYCKTMIKISIILLTSLFFNNIAFPKSKEIPYLRNGISFSLADKWKVIANDSIGNNAYYFSAERVGANATGLITITWVNKLENPQETILMHQQTMKNSNIYRNPGIEFSSVVHDNFAGLKVESCRYTTIVKEQKLDGEVYCFNSFEKTITIFFQSGMSDKKLNQKAFELIKITFNCRD